MGLSVEIKEESDSCDCCADCKMGSGMAMPAAAPMPAPKTRDQLLTELKKLLNQQGTQGGTTQEERQVLIDDVIEQLDDLADQAEGEND